MDPCLKNAIDRIFPCESGRDSRRFRVSFSLSSLRENSRDAFFLSFLPFPLFSFPSSFIAFYRFSPFTPRFEESAVSTREGLEACRALAIQLRGTLVVRREKWRHFCATHDSILEDRKIRKRVVNGGFPRKIFRPSHGNARGSIRRMMARISFIPRHKYPSCQSRIILFSSLLFFAYRRFQPTIFIHDQ